MSEIFDALQNAPGEVQQIALSVIQQAGAMPAHIGEVRNGVPGPANDDAAPVFASPAGNGHTQNGRENRVRAAGAGPDVRVCRLNPPESAAVIVRDAGSPEAAEQYRLIRTRITHDSRGAKLLAISSAGAGDGKTVTAINLAATLAMRSRNTTVLVDADLRRSAVACTLGIPTEPGLTDVLRNSCTLDDGLVRAESIPNLYVLPAGAPCMAPAELLDSPRWGQLISALRDRFQYTVFDTPPIGAVADYDLVQAVADGVVLVVRPDHTDRRMCKTALGRITAEKFLGVVINCACEWLLWRTNQSYHGYYVQRQRPVNKS